jgi:hypothetical protein
MPKVPMPETSPIPVSPRAKRLPFRDLVAGELNAMASTTGSQDLDSLRVMNGLAAMSTLIDELIVGQVVEMKTSGYSWSEIGAALGMTRQATQQRYGKNVNTD